MKRIFLTVGLCYLLVSCANTDSNPAIAIQKDTSKMHPKGLSEKITGAWTLVGEENATFLIEKNKIFYPETVTAYDYQLSDDFIKVNYDGYVGTFQVEMKGEDTLVLKDEEEQTYYRFK